MTRRLPLLSARAFAVALGLGAINTLTFAPTPHGGWLQLPVFAALYWLVARAPGRLGAGLTGFAFGFGNFASGLYWLYISMHDYGGMAMPLAAAAVALFSAYLALYPALATATWHAVHARRRATTAGTLLSAAVFGGVWALGEWLRGTVFTGFPWLAVGYAQVDGPFAGFASLIGVYGVGFVTAMAGAVIAQCLSAWAARRTTSAGSASMAESAPVAAAGSAPVASARSAPAAVSIAAAKVTRAVATFVVLLAAGLGLPAWRFTAPTVTPLTVRLLQGNVPQDIKFEQAGLDHSLALYQRLITEQPADLVVTPETALPILINDTPIDFAIATREFADRTGTAILLGAAGVIDRNGATAYTNSTFGLTPGRRELYRYDKHHLVPFGEFVPWGFRWFVNLMHIPLGDFARGPVVQAPFMVKGERFAVNICYEDLFGDEIARSLRTQADPANVLVNSTNLAWFGNTIALAQHLQISQMRALEMQRPVLRSTNTGMTAAIDAHGHVQARLPSFTVGALDIRVQGMSGLTPYIRCGDAPVLIAALLLLAAALRRNFRPRTDRQAAP